MFVSLSRMKTYVLVVAFVCVLTLAKSEIDFVDCGSSFEVTDVEVQSCDFSPCVIATGDTRVITVNTRNLDPEIDDMESKAYISFMGQTWELYVTPDSPCIEWGCPLRESRTRTYKGAITFDASLIRRPATVTLKTMYNSVLSQEVAFCVSFGVEMI